MDNKDILRSKELLSSYKKRLEKEIINRSNKLRIPEKILQELIDNNVEIQELKNALQKLEINNSSSTSTDV